MQVGQTEKTVRTAVNSQVWTSGAIQHLAGDRFDYQSDRSRIKKATKKHRYLPVAD